MIYFKKFEYNFDKTFLLDFYKNQESQRKIKKSGPYFHSDHTLLLDRRLPFFEIIETAPSKDNFGVSKILENTGYHINPKNNGLIVLPLEGTIIIEFFNFSLLDHDESMMGKKMPTVLQEQVKQSFLSRIEIDQPTAFYGKITHNFVINKPGAIFYAVKIPTEFSWDKLIECL